MNDITEKNKYVCEKCNFNCNTKARWNAHINTTLHQTGIKKKRSDYKEPIKCDSCNYETKNITSLKMHKLNNHSSIEDKKKEFKYYCINCDFGCLYENFMKKHNETIKHKYKISKK